VALAGGGIPNLTGHDSARIARSLRQKTLNDAVSFFGSRERQPDSSLMNYGVDPAPQYVIEHVSGCPWFASNRGRLSRSTWKILV
jgi:hypothetical protein